MAKIRKPNQARGRGKALKDLGGGPQVARPSQVEIDAQLMNIAGAISTNMKTAIVIGVSALLVVGTAVLVLKPVQPLGKSIPGSRLRLPVGTGTPAIALGARHGVIL